MPQHACGPRRGWGEFSSWKLHSDNITYTLQSPHSAHCRHLRPAVSFCHSVSFCHLIVADKEAEAWLVSCFHYFCLVTFIFHQMSVLFWPFFDSRIDFEYSITKNTKTCRRCTDALMIILINLLSHYHLICDN